jgi:hypothetical protein
LPSILALFRQSFPRIQVELRCSLSTPLVALVSARRGRYRTRHAHARFQRRRSRTPGAADLDDGERYDIHRANPVPLALLPPGNIYRDHAIEGLERAGRKWRIACVSESVGGLQAAVFAGMAVTVLVKRASRRDAPDRAERIFSAAPKSRSSALSSARLATAAATALHDYLAHYLSLEPGTDAKTAQAAASISETATSTGGKKQALVQPGPRRFERSSDTEDALLLEPGRDELQPNR